LGLLFSAYANFGSEDATVADMQIVTALARQVIEQYHADPKVLFHGVSPLESILLNEEIVAILKEHGAQCTGSAEALETIVNHYEVIPHHGVCITWKIACGESVVEEVCTPYRVDPYAELALTDAIENTVMADI
jgi:hypothetical protein